MPTKTRERKSPAENDKRMEELKRLIAMQDSKFEEANAKITAANQKIQSVSESKTHSNIYYEKPVKLLKMETMKHLFPTLKLQHFINLGS